MVFNKPVADKLKEETKPSSLTASAAMLRSYSQPAAGKPSSSFYFSTD